MLGHLKMLYIFHVDTGTMMTFEMNLALESVSNLQSVIDKIWRIPVEKQVLLVSGGESLDPNARVCSYSAGTDTNPIYLFSKSVIESTNPPTPSLDFAIADTDLKDAVDASSQMPAKYSTVVARANLAQQFYELAREQTKVCERLVQEQHLQQQGWSAVVANLEDITSEFRSRADRFQYSFQQYLELRENYLDFLKNFNKDLITLSKIPLLPALEAAPENILENCPSTLLSWISAADNQSTLDQVAEQCTRGLEQLNFKVVDTLCADVKTALDAANNAQMKEVKGLNDRLQGLEQLMCECKKFVQEQSDLAQAFLQNQNRATNLGDESILPDLCASHRRQLLVMLENHQRLRDIRRRCTRAKEELSVNLYHRLKWIMYVENLILETDHKLMIYHESLKRLRRHVEIIQQIHLAPAMYVNAVAEVVRRRAFSQAFLLWASELACHILTIHNEEVAKRKEFQQQFEGHFLATLFPGLEDLPPSFATQAPSIFDSRLPKLTSDDITRLKNDLPEDLTKDLIVPDVNSIAHMFFVKSSGIIKDHDMLEVAEIHVEKEEFTEEEKNSGVDDLNRTVLLKQENETFLSAHSALPHLKDFDKGCESETDTEEFEKVSQSPLELQFVESQSNPKVTTVSPRRRCFKDASTTTITTKTTAIATNTATIEVGPFVQSEAPRKPPRLFLPKVPSPHPRSVKHSQSCLASLYSLTQQGQGHQFKKPSIVNSMSCTFPPTSVGCAGSCCCCSSQQHFKHLQFHNNFAEFVTDEFYIDESLPSSLTTATTTTTTNCNELSRQLDQANSVIALFQMVALNSRFPYTDNLSTSKIENQKLKSLLHQLSKLTAETIKQLRNEMEILKTNYNVQLHFIQSHCVKIDSKWRQIISDCETREREALQRLTVDHELEQSDLKKIIQDKCDENQRLQNICLEKNQIQQTLIEQQKYLDELKSSLENAEKEKEKAVKEARDLLISQHKDEMDSIRTRFKLLKDRNPSDSSHEKIEHLEIVKQMREDFDLELKKAVKEAILEEQRKWQKKLDYELTQLRIRNEQEKQVLFNEAMRRVVEEKEKQIDCLKAREASLSLECLKYKTTIQQLTETEIIGTNVSTLLEQVKTLEKEKMQLELELNAAVADKTKRIRYEMADLSTSVAVIDTKQDHMQTSSASSSAATRIQNKLTRSQTSLIQTGRINIASCNIGDVVLVIWEPNYKNYVILQDSNVLYFLHFECLDILGLKPLTDSQTEHRKLYATAEVIFKEYCHAKKAENRYHVDRGTKFYRVKVRPLSLISSSSNKQSCPLHVSSTTTNSLTSSTSTLVGIWSRDNSCGIKSVDAVDGSGASSLNQYISCENQSDNFHSLVFNTEQQSALPIPLSPIRKTDTQVELSDNKSISNEIPPNLEPDTDQQ